MKSRKKGARPKGIRPSMGDAGSSRNRLSRAEIMRRVGSEDTHPELTLRKALHAEGYRYRLHRRDLPGSPDIVFPSKRKAVFVHGCFWHRHPGCSRASTPKSNFSYWQEKFDRNVLRDIQALKELRSLGWKTMVVWECGLTKKSVAVTLDRVVRFLSN